MLDKIIADILIVAILVHIFDEIFNIFTGRVNHSCVVAKL